MSEGEDGGRTVYSGTVPYHMIGLLDGARDARAHVQVDASVTESVDKRVEHGWSMSMC